MCQGLAVNSLEKCAERTILIHVGQGKTASSYLQSCLALSISDMSRQGVAYPISELDRERGASGHVSMGNFRPRSREAGHFSSDLKALVDQTDWDKHQSTIISNEGIYISINYKGFLPSLLEATKGYKLKFLMIIRDPFEHALSVYQQGLKANLINDADDHFGRKYNAPIHTRDFVNLLQDHDVEVEISNYSRHRSGQIQVFEKWIGLDPGTLKSVSRESINRSLTRAEMEVQKAFNKHVGSRARIMIADFLSNELPNVRSENPFIKRAVVEMFLERINRLVDEVAPLIPKGEAYKVPTLEDAMAQLPSEEDAGDFHLSAEQIDALARGISRWIKKG